MVLVHAAAGGVGQGAVRLARHYGAHVIATASPAKHVTVKALGADEVLDSRRPDLAAEITRLPGGVDLALESVGKETFGPAWRSPNPSPDASSSSAPHPATPADHARPDLHPPRPPETHPMPRCRPVGGGGGSSPPAWAVCAPAPTGWRRRGRLGGPSLRRSW
ncbi:zinc-binding dehydrogenase [Streptomyces oryzae]|uniref:zinc-binding dehydrogenase n=1 Tax=Streptomyces oryzae TaxID=1434886 RepID=UPI0027DD44BF|nr:zinc-binding dehydrogenase [Streptomyces oryzae]